MLRSVSSHAVLFIIGPALPYLTGPLYDIQQTGEVILGKDIDTF